VNAERSAAREAFRLLRLVLDGGRSDEDYDVAALPLVPEPVTESRIEPVTEPKSAPVAAPVTRPTVRALKPRRRHTAGSARQ
jgi:hypothetical protein